MRPRPLAVTLAGWFFIAAGLIGFGYHLRGLSPADPLAHDAIAVLSIRLLAIVGGAFLLRGHGWARWLLVAWMAWHVWLGARHSLPSCLLHGLMLLALVWLLFRPASRAFFSLAGPPGASSPPAAPPGWGSRLHPPATSRPAACTEGKGGPLPPNQPP